MHGVFLVASVRCRSWGAGGSQLAGPALDGQSVAFFSAIFLEGLAGDVTEVACPLPVAYFFGAWRLGDLMLRIRPVDWQ